MEQQANTSHFILHLPKWYPSKADPQLGVFIKKQIVAVSGLYKNIIIYPSKSSDCIKKYEVEMSEDSGILCIIINYREFSHDGHPLKKIVNGIRYYKALLKGNKTLIKEKGKPDLVHVHVLLRLGIFAYYYWIVKKVPYVISEHWSGYVDGKFGSKTFLYKFILRYVARKAKAIISVTELLKNAMISNNVRNNDFYVVPNVINKPEVNENNLKRISNELQILTVADLVDEIKNISGILKALSKVKNHIKSFRYHLIGDGEDRELLISLSKVLGLDGKVEFHGQKSNEFVHDFIREIDFLVVNSNVETFSIVTAEALIHGKPVIGTICGGPEMFINDKNGILIHPGNQLELQNALIRMADSFMDYDEKVISGSIDEKYNSEKIAEKLVNIYSSILNKQTNN